MSTLNDTRETLKCQLKLHPTQLTGVVEEFGNMKQENELLLEEVETFGKLPPPPLTQPPLGTSEEVLPSVTEVNDAADATDDVIDEVDDDALDAASVHNVNNDEEGANHASPSNDNPISPPTSNVEVASAEVGLPPFVPSSSTQALKQLYFDNDLTVVEEKQESSGFLGESTATQVGETSASSIEPSIPSANEFDDVNLLCSLLASSNINNSDQPISTITINATKNAASSGNEHPKSVTQMKQSQLPQRKRFLIHYHQQEQHSNSTLDKPISVPTASSSPSSQLNSHNSFQDKRPRLSPCIPTEQLSSQSGLIQVSSVGDNVEYRSIVDDDEDEEEASSLKMLRTLINQTNAARPKVARTVPLALPPALVQPVSNKVALDHTDISKSKQTPSSSPPLSFSSSSSSSTASITTSNCHTPLYANLFPANFHSTYQTAQKLLHQITLYAALSRQAAEVANCKLLATRFSRLHSLMVATILHHHSGKTIIQIVQGEHLKAAANLRGHLAQLNRKVKELLGRLYQALKMHESAEHLEEKAKLEQVYASFDSAYRSMMQQLCRALTEAPKTAQSSQNAASQAAKPAATAATIQRISGDSIDDAAYEFVAAHNQKYEGD